MDFDSGIPMSRPPVTAQVSSSLSPPLDEAEISDALWQLNLRSSMESGPYPVREGEPDCSYYIRTGLCRFGATCRFNHPANRKLAIATAKMMGEYPERAGQPECQYYLKTGTCKFGATCKFDHPRDKAGIAGRVSLNVLGYPLRPNEAECGYYLRTGQCKFGNTCKFHHPQPSNMMVTYSGSPVYPTLQPPTSPGQQGEITNWSLPQASFVPSPRWQAPSSYTQMILPQGVVSLPAYRGSSDSQHHASGSNQIYGLARENVFPERPGQPDCQFYIKTGDCKFGAVCRFHHPRERVIPAPDCVLSPIGLPIRPGEPLCIFYSRYGICKFGPSCKFDHPMGVFSYNFSSNSGDDGRLLPSSSSGNMTSQGPIEGGSITQMPSTDNNTIDQQE